MASIINASPTNGIVQTADGSGVLKIQSNSVTTNALAWVNFNGTGTVAIRSSYNVSSITDNGTHLDRIDPYKYYELHNLLHLCLLHLRR